MMIFILLFSLGSLSLVAMDVDKEDGQCKKPRSLIELPFDVQNRLGLLTQEPSNLLFEIAVYKSKLNQEDAEIVINAFWKKCREKEKINYSVAKLLTQLSFFYQSVPLDNQDAIEKALVCNAVYCRITNENNISFFVVEKKFRNDYIRDRRSLQQKAVMDIASRMFFTDTEVLKQLKFPLKQLKWPYSFPVKIQNQIGLLTKNPNNLLFKIAVYKGDLSNENASLVMKAFTRKCMDAWFYSKIPVLFLQKLCNFYLGAPENNRKLFEQMLPAEYDQEGMVNNKLSLQQKAVLYAAEIVKFETDRLKEISIFSDMDRAEERNENSYFAH